jgi:hypothetical protein
MNHAVKRPWTKPDSARARIDATFRQCLGVNMSLPSAEAAIAIALKVHGALSNEGPEAHDWSTSLRL